jgi:hypothetical protein
LRRQAELDPADDAKFLAPRRKKWVLLIDWPVGLWSWVFTEPGSLVCALSCRSPRTQTGVETFESRKLQTQHHAMVVFASITASLLSFIYELGQVPFTKPQLTQLSISTPTSHALEYTLPSKLRLMASLPTAIAYLRPLCQPLSVLKRLQSTWDTWPGYPDGLQATIGTLCTAYRALPVWVCFVCLPLTFLSSGQ